MKLISSLAVFVAVFFLPTTSAISQEKVESGVHAELRLNPLVRVLIVTRPDPEQTNGGASLNSASSYVSQSLADWEEMFELLVRCR